MIELKIFVIVDIKWHITLKIVFPKFFVSALCLYQTFTSLYAFSQLPKSDDIIKHIRATSKQVNVTLL